MIKKENFTILTKQKGQIYNGRKITNNSTHIILYNGKYIAEVKTKSAAVNFISNLIKYQKLQYTQVY